MRRHSLTISFEITCIFGCPDFISDAAIERRNYRPRRNRSSQQDSASSELSNGGSRTFLKLRELVSRFGHDRHQMVSVLAWTRLCRHDSYKPIQKSWSAREKGSIFSFVKMNCADHRSHDLANMASTKIEKIGAIS